MSKYFALVSSEISDVELCSLKKHHDVFVLPADHSIDAPVASHPDMILCASEGFLVLHGAYYKENKNEIDHIASLSGLQIIASNCPRGKVYPSDVGFNAAISEHHIICNKNTVSTEILRIASESELEIIHTKQGYTSCSCIVTDRVVITSDRGIHRACEASGVNSRLVSNRGISLPGYDVGFIGGAGGFCDGVLYFYGSLTGMECEEDIRKIAREYGYTICELSNSPLTDRGGIKFIKYK